MTGARVQQPRALSYRFAAFEFDTLRLELRRHGELLEVEPKPLEVLAELLAAGGELVTKGELMESVWGGRAVTDYVLTRCINRLRAALDDGTQSLIISVYGQGYRLAAPVQWSETPPLAALAAHALAAGQAVPQRPQWRLEKPLDEQAGLWLARQQKTGERRVFKFALQPERIPGLKRELTLHRLLKATLGEREDFVRLLDFNLETAPYFLEIEWCAQGSLADWLAAQGGAAAVPLKLRLELLAQAAESLAAAHSAGVLHLDVKPANLLVWTRHDGRPQIRWIDFGSGRLLDPQRLDQLGITRMGLQTEAAADSGTLMYLAPEVIAGQPATALSDVFALGVMLYQLVAGDLRKPLTAGWERDVSDPLLREDIAAAAAGDAAQRLGSATELARRLRSLPERQIDRAQQQAREQAAAELGQRLARVRARRPWLVGATLALTAGLAASLWFYGTAVRARQEAQAQAARAEAVTRFLDDDVLGGASPYQAGNSHELTVSEALARAAARLDGRFPGQPLTEAQIHLTIATLDTQLEHLPAAEQQARQARTLFASQLGPADPQTLAADTLLGLDLMGQSRFAEARQMLDEMEAALRSVKQPDAQRLAQLMGMRQTVARFEQRYPDHLAIVQRRLADEPANASPPSVGHLLLESSLALDQTRLGHFDLAEATDRHVLSALPKLEAPNSSFSALMNAEHGLRLYLMGRSAPALQALDQAHAELLRLLGPEDESTAESLVYRGLARLQTGQTAEAERDCREAYQAMARHFGAASYFALMAQGPLGMAEFANAHGAAAMHDLNQAADGLQALLGWPAPSVQYFRYQVLAHGGAGALDSHQAHFDAALLAQAAPAEDWPRRLAALAH